MSKILYPQLHSAGWVENHRELTAKEWMEIVGCSLRQVRSVRRENNIRQENRPKILRRWTEIEQQALHEFYPRYHAKFLAKTLRRSQVAVWKKASKKRCKENLGYRQYIRGNLKSDEEEDFWDDWREFIRENWRRWAAAGWSDEVLQMTWEPGMGNTKECKHCEHACIGSESKLPCERVDVGEALGRTR